MRNAALLIALVFVVIGCKQTKTKRTGIGDDSEVMGTGIESADVEAMSKLAQSMLEVPELTSPHLETVPMVAIYPIRNETRHDFDAELLVKRLQAELVEKSNGKVRFVVRNKQDLAVLEEERSAKRSGEVTSNKQVVRKGADYYLTGSANAISQTSGKLEQDAIYVFFELRDPETSEIIWGRKYATKKVGKAGVIYR